MGAHILKSAGEIKQIKKKIFYMHCKLIRSENTCEIHVPQVEFSQDLFFLQILSFQTQGASYNSTVHFTLKADVA